MSRIVWVGNPFFAASLAESGWKILRLNFGPGEYFDWPALRAKADLDADDILVLADKSLPPALLGVEDFPCLTVFYSVDSHIHSWHPLYAQAFDLCLVSLRDNLENFGKGRLGEEQLLWMPPCLLTRPVSPDAPEAAEKLWDLLFVGKADPAVNPGRVDFLRRLKDFLPGLHHRRGDYVRLYPQARLVLNHSIAGDLNFRVFEALGSGACLLTPRLRHGLEDLFTDGRDLFLFDQEDPAGLADLAKDLLLAPERRMIVARSGFQKVMQGHLAGHRAAVLSDRLRAWRESGRDQLLIRERRAQARQLRQNLRLMYLLLAENLEAHPALRQAYLAVGAKSD